MQSKTKGTIFILISAVFYASYGIWSKLMGHSFGEFTQAWTRGLFLLIIIILLNQKLKIYKPFKKSDWPWFIMIALAGGINQAPYYYGFQHLDIGTATLLFYASLVIGGYLQSKLALKEQFSKSKIISLIIAVLGMSLIYRFTLTSSQIIPALFTCLAGFLGASTVVLTKKLSSNFHELQIMIGYFVMQVVFNLPLALILHETLPAFSHSSAWLAQLAYAISLFLANFTAIEGFKYLEGSVGSLIGMAEILFGVLFGLLLFGEILTPSTIIGGLLIILAASLPSLLEIKKQGS
ncbi:MAG: DMT family transporter [Candidatus Beckwithbacteria bacterium]|nr:DMT family transporter [Patescibacteria group bacterium]